MAPSEMASARAFSLGRTCMSAATASLTIFSTRSDLLGCHGLRVIEVKAQPVGRDE